MIFVRIPGMGDNSIKTKGYGDGDWFIADSFSFGAERDTHDSGERRGPEDINIGVGELQECTISKSMDMASMVLAQFAINGNSPGTAEIDFVKVARGGDSDGKPICYLKFKLERCFVTSWSTSGDADDRPTEEVAFYYNKIAAQYATIKDGKVSERSSIMAWDNTKQVKWDGPGIRW